MNDIKDVKPPVNLPDFMWILWLLLAVIVIAAAVYLFLRFWKPAAKPAAPPPPPLPAWDLAYQELEALRRQQLLEKGQFKEFMTRVADISRHYMENRFDIHAPHMTTEEFLYSLSLSGHLNDAQKSALENFLNSCDMVKFAKYAPSTNEAMKNFDLAVKLVNDTRPDRKAEGSGNVDARI